MQNILTYLFHLEAFYWHKKREYTIALNVSTEVSVLHSIGYMLLVVLIALHIYITQRYA
jgi:hypothetical protein